MVEVQPEEVHMGYLEREKEGVEIGHQNPVGWLGGGGGGGAVGDCCVC